MFQKIIAKIAIDLRANGFADLDKINNANIDIGQFHFANSKRIDLRQLHCHFSAGALTFLRADNFRAELVREIRRKQRRPRPGIENEIEWPALVYMNRQKDDL